MDKHAKDDASNKQAQMNAVWQRIADKADEQAAVERWVRAKREASLGGNQKRRLSKVQKILIVVVVLVLIMAAGFAVWFFAFRGMSDVDEEPTVTEQANEIALVDTNSSEELSEMIGASQSTYEEYFNELLHTDATTWTAEDIEKAYYCLAYASKVELFQDATSLLANIDYAIANGVQVYNSDLTEEFVNSVREQINNNDPSRGAVYEKPY